MQGRVDFDASRFHVHHIGGDSFLDYFRGDVDAFGGEYLDERFRNNASAMVAAFRSTLGKIAWFVDVEGDVQIGSLGNIEKEITEEATGGSSSDNGYFRSVLKSQGPRVLGVRACMQLDILHFESIAKMERRQENSCDAFLNFLAIFYANACTSENSFDESSKYD